MLHMHIFKKIEERAWSSSYRISNKLIPRTVLQSYLLKKFVAKTENIDLLVTIKLYPIKFR